MTLEEIKRACDTLANSDDYTNLKRDITTLAGTTSGLFGEPHEALNPLIELARRDGIDRLKAIFALIENARRRARPKADKTDYQRTHMADRRRRLTKGIALYERLTKKKLTPTEKADMRETLQTLWVARRDQVIENRYDLTRVEQNELTRLYWAELETNLDLALKGDEVVGQMVLGL